MNEREAFEQWAQPKGYLLERLQDNSSSYEFDDTRWAWEGWKARAALASQDAEIARLRDSAIAVVQRWHTPLWSAEFIDKLALALGENNE
jgi:hypothetical protein